MVDLFTDLRARTSSHLHELADAVARSTVPIERVWTLDLATYRTRSDADELKDDIANWAHGSNCFLYAYEITSAFEHEKLRNTYAIEAARKQRAYARLNTSTSSWLYAGGAKDVATRTRQHLGFGNKDTYAMHLCHWAVGLTLGVRLTIAKYETDPGKEVRQALEDGLWERTRPILGRKGAK